MRGIVQRWDPMLWALAVLASLYFVYRYGIDTSRPGLMTPRGWYDRGGDQDAYHVIALQMADLEFPSRLYSFGPGYPAVAVPSMWLGFDRDPFVVPDGLAYVFTVLASYVVADRLFGRLASAIAGFGLIFATNLVQWTVTPWNSTVVMIGMAVVLLLATSPRLRPAHFWVMGAMAGWAFSARYVDAIWLGVLSLAAVLLLDDRRSRVKAAAAVVVASLIVAGPTFFANANAFGSPLETPYSQRILPGGGTEGGLAAYDLGKVPRTFFAEFFSPYLLGEGQLGTPLFDFFFWSFLAIPGVVLLLLRRTRFTPLIATYVVLCLVSLVFYLSFVSVGAQTVANGSLHYLKLWWPGWAIAASGAIAWFWEWAWARRREPARPA